MLSENSKKPYSSYKERLNNIANAKLTVDNLDDYQLEGNEFVKRVKKCCVFFDTGKGKTGLCLKFISDMVNDLDYPKPGFRVLVISTKLIIRDTWPDEIKDWSFSANFKHYLVRNDVTVKQMNAASRSFLKYNNINTVNKKYKQAVVNKAKADIKKYKKDNGHNCLTEHEENVLFNVYVQKFSKEMMYRLATKEANKVLVNDAKLNLKNNKNIIHLISKDNIDNYIEALKGEFPYDAVIYDESSSLKHSTSARWKALRNVVESVDYFIELTATPMAEKPANIYGQITLLDGGKRLGSTFYEFEDTYFNTNRFNKYEKTIRPGALDEIIKKISDITFAADANTDYTVNEIDVLLSMTKAETELYNKLQKECVLNVPKQYTQNTINENCDVKISSKHAATLALKLLQMASGVIYDNKSSYDVLELSLSSIKQAYDRDKPDIDFTEYTQLKQFENQLVNGKIINDRIVYNIHNHKIQAIKEILFDLDDDEPVILAYWHKSTLDKLQKEFPDAATTNDSNFKKDWNDKKIKILLLHPMSGAHGLNLQHGGHTIIIVDTFWSYELYYQLWRRLGRRGQVKKEIDVYRLLMDKSMDLVVRDAWVSKKSGQSKMLNEVLKLTKRIMRRLNKNDKKT